MADKTDDKPRCIRLTSNGDSKKMERGTVKMNSTIDAKKAAKLPDLDSPGHECQTCGEFHSSALDADKCPHKGYFPLVWAMWCGTCLVFFHTRETRPESPGYTRCNIAEPAGYFYTHSERLEICSDEGYDCIDVDLKDRERDPHLGAHWNSAEDRNEYWSHFVQWRIGFLCYACNDDGGDGVPPFFTGIGAFDSDEQAVYDAIRDHILNKHHESTTERDATANRVADRS